MIFGAFVLLIFYNKIGLTTETITKIPGPIYTQIGIAISEAKKKGVTVTGYDITIKIDDTKTYISFSNPSMPSRTKGQRGNPEGAAIFGVELRNGEVVSSSFVR